MTPVAAYVVERAVRPRAPFDFAQSLTFLCNFGAASGEQATDDGRLRKAFRVDGTTVVVDVVATGTTERPALRCSLHSAAALPGAVETRALERLRFYLSTDEELGEFYALAKADSAFATIARSLHGYHQVKFPTPFENACWAILGQRCPLAVARKMKTMVVRELGEALSVEGQELRAFPEPADLEGVSSERMASIIGNAVKGRRLCAVANAFDRIDESFLKTAATEQVRAWLLSIEGIGPWSANFVMVRGLGRTDTLGGIEASLMPAISKLYGSSSTIADVRRIAARYGSWQAYWAHYLRVAA